jgi:hypothetical protein
MTTALVFAPGLIQAFAMLADEGVCHRRRGLPRWERIGHPLDTLTTALCYGWLCIAAPADAHALVVYVGLSLFSCLFITKDEFVHAELCGGLESWLHAVLFVIHPIVLLGFGVAWLTGWPPWVFRAQLLLTLAFAGYQVLYWNRT